MQKGWNSMQVPFLDLKVQFASIRDEVMPAVAAVLDSQDCCNGVAVRELEKALAEYCGCAAAVGVSSGTDALLCSMMALGIGPGDEVITPTFTFFATAGCIWRAGAKPVFVDIQPDTLNLDPSKIGQAVTPRTKAIIPVHLYGQMADMAPIQAVAKKHGLFVIEDVAQSIGASQKGRKAGSLGTVGCLSFYPTKNLGGVGDAGMIVTQDAQLAKTLAVFRNHGESSRYHHKHVGGNFRLDSIQAAALLVKLRHLDRWTAMRRSHATIYDEMLAGIDGLRTPVIGNGNFSIYNQYVVRTPRRDALKDYLARQGVGSGIYYPLCLHQQECFASLGGKAGDFPNAEAAAAEVLALPIYPELSDEQIRYVATKVREFLGE